MKNALILHGTDGNSQENWFPWLEQQLKNKGYKVWVPELPQASHPNINRYNQFLLNNNDWNFNEDSIIIGHSSGAVAILGLLQALPKDVKVGACYLVGSFKDDLGWDVLTGLFEEPFDFDNIKQQSRLFYFIHSDNDPYCPLEHAEYVHRQIGGDLIVLPNQKHFSVGTYGKEYRQFPYLLDLITGKNNTADFVAGFYQQLKNMGIKIWLDGGWAVDALLEKETRLHSDVDVVVQQKDLEAVKKLLLDQEFVGVKRGDSTAWNFIMGDKQARFVDFHVIKLDEKGDGIYGPKENGDKYPKDSLTGEGKINGISVKCISPEWLVKFHTGYQPRKQDIHDVKLLCEEFSIKLPKEYE